MEEVKKKEVFISYKFENIQIAKGICNLLESNGYSCWIAPRDETPGKDYGEMINIAISECKAVVLVASSLINESQHILSEVDIAFNKKKPIICYETEEFTLSEALAYRLNNIHRILANDFTNDNEKSLLSAVKLFVNNGGEIGNCPVQTARADDGSGKEGDNSAAERMRLGVVDWGDAPPHMDIFGRKGELEWLKKKLYSGVRIFCLVGVGGIGKSTLARNWADTFTGESDAVIWISFKNRPDPAGVFRKICQLLVPGRTIPVKDVDGHIDDVIKLLGNKKAVIILDNMESVMQSGDQTGEFIDGFAPVERFLKRFADIKTQSTVMLTTRELPDCVEALSCSNPSVCQYVNLPGLDIEAVRQLVASHRLVWNKEENLIKFSEHHGGSPYAITLTASTVLSDFNGVIDDYIESRMKLPSKLMKLLDTQISRLSDLQRTILYLLAVERVPVPLQTIQEALQHSYFEDEIKDALTQLRHRSLLEPVNENGCYYIQNVLSDYATDQICKEMTGSIINILNAKQAKKPDKLLRDLHIITATAPHEIREAQMRTLVKPVCKNVIARFGAARIRSELYKTVREMGNDPACVGFASGTLVTMMLQLSEELNGLDLSDRLLWSCDFECSDLIDANFSGSDLRLSRFREILAAVSSVTFGRSKNQIFFGTSDGKVHFQDVSEKSLNAKKIHFGYVRGMAYDKKNGALLTVGEDKTLHVLDPENLFERENVVTEKHGLRFVSVSADGGRIWGGDNGITVQSDGKNVLREEDQASGIVRDGCFTGEDKVAFVTENGVVKCGRFMSPAGEMKSTIFDNEPLWCITAVGDGYLVAGKQGKIRMLDGDLRQVGPDFENADSPIWHIVAGNNYYVAATSIGALLFYDKVTGRIMYRVPAHENWIRALSADPSGNYILSGSADQSVKIYSENTRELQFELEGESLNFMAVTDTGKYLIAGGTDGLLHCWEHGSQRARRIHRPYNSWIRALSYSAAEDAVVIGYSTGTIELWDLKTDKFRQIGIHPGGDVWALDFHPTLPMFLSAGEDGKVLQWSKDSLGNWNHREVYDFGRWAIECRYSNDGKKIACGDAVGRIVIADGENYKILPLQEQADQAWGIVWSKDDKKITVAERSGKLRFWTRTEEGTPVCTSVSSASANWDIAISEDGKTIAVVGDRGYVTFIKGDKTQQKKLSEGRIRAIVACRGKNTFAVAGYDGVVSEITAEGDVADKYVPDMQYSRLNVSDAINLSDFQLSSIKQFGGLE